MIGDTRRELQLRARLGCGSRNPSPRAGHFSGDGAVCGERQQRWRMSKPRGTGPGGPQDPELHEFASRTPLLPADPAFRDALRSALWELLVALVTRMRGR